MSSFYAFHVHLQRYEFTIEFEGSSSHTMVRFEKPRFFDFDVNVDDALTRTIKAWAQPNIQPYALTNEKSKNNIDICISYLSNHG